MNDMIERKTNGSTLPRLRGNWVRTIGASLAAIGILGAVAACQPPPTVEIVEVKKCELPIFNEGRKFDIDAWAIPDAVFDVGEPFRLQMRVSTPAYMNIFYVSTSCKVTRLLHNHSVAAADIVDFPLAESGLQMTVKPPTGDEALYFVATREQMDFLAGADILSETAGIARLDLSPDQFYQRVRDARGRINPDDWSIATLLTSVVGH